MFMPVIVVVIMHMFMVMHFTVVMPMFVIVYVLMIMTVCMSLFLICEKYIYVGSCNRISLSGLKCDLISFQVQFFQFRQELFFICPKINQSSQRHISADSGRTVKIQYLL